LSDVQNRQEIGGCGQGSVSNDDTHLNLIEPRGTRHAGIETATWIDFRAATGRPPWRPSFRTRYWDLAAPSLSLSGASETRISRIDTRIVCGAAVAEFVLLPLRARS
jgi:hypothetical protein